MDLPRAVLRTHGARAVGVELRRGWTSIGGWLRPRLAPLAITAFATLCMLAALDLVAGPIRAARAKVRSPEPVPVYLLTPQPAPRQCTFVPLDEPSTDLLSDVAR